MTDDEESRERLRSLLLETVETQINDGEPPETRETLERLMSEGYSEQEALHLIGCAMSVEIFGIIKNSQPYDEARYLKALKDLPELPPE